MKRENVVLKARTSPGKYSDAVDDNDSDNDNHNGGDDARNDTKNFIECVPFLETRLL